MNAFQISFFTPKLDSVLKVGMLDIPRRLALELTHKFGSSWLTILVWPIRGILQPSYCSWIHTPDRQKFWSWERETYFDPHQDTCGFGEWSLGTVNMGSRRKRRLWMTPFCWILQIDSLLLKWWHAYSTMRSPRMICSFLTLPWQNMKQWCEQPNHPLDSADLILPRMPYDIRDHQLTHLPMLGTRRRSKLGEGGRLWKAYKDIRNLGRCKLRWIEYLLRYGQKQQLLCLRFSRRFFNTMGVPPSDTMWAWDQTLLLEDAPCFYTLHLSFWSVVQFPSDSNFEVPRSYASLRLADHAFVSYGWSHSFLCAKKVREDRADW